MNSSSPKSTSKQTLGKTVRRWLPTVAGIAFVGLMVWGFWPKPVPVETARVSTGLLRATVNDEGKTRIRQRYVVSAPVTGQVRRVLLKAGDVLESTQQVVAVIDPISPALLDARARSVAEAHRDSAAAQMERARAAHKFASSELQRNEKLHHEKTVSTQDLEQFQWRETSAARELTAAEAALRQAEAEMFEFTHSATNGVTRAPIELFAPVAGRVLKVFEESSRTVQAGTPLLEAGDPTDLEVIVEVLSRDGANIKAGTPVEFEQWGGSEPLKGRVRFVEPAAFTKISALGVEEQRVFVVADLLTPPAARGNLGDNFRVEARIITWQSDRALKAPSGALFRTGNQWSAYVMVNGRADLRMIKVGQSSGTEAEILEGLKEGEAVILYPGDRVRPGQRVKLASLRGAGK